MTSVSIRDGALAGESLAGGVRAFKGIPFAAPPVGALRWKPPQPGRPWAGVRECLRYGPACAQPAVSRLIGQRFERTGEDCLYLNVWTPATNTSDRLPTMVWIHGGAFVIGSASADLYEGARLARRGAVVVTINYRLGPFGFLAHPLLSAESPHGVSGNYGLLDQLAALEWVRDNVAAFGGDPQRVTLFGESGGGRSVAHLMTSPLARGLFHRAILQSSTVYRPIQHLREGWYGRPPMERVGLEIGRALGCDHARDPLAAMRGMHVDEILAASNPGLPALVPSEGKGTPFEPIVDGWLIPDDPGDLFEAGKQHPIPLIGGTNADEGSLFIQRLRFAGRSRYRQLVREIFPEHAEAIIALFPGDDVYRELNRLLTDMGTTAPMRSTVRSMERVGAPAWLYHFTRVRSDLVGRVLGTWHGSEIRFVFDQLDAGRTRVEQVDRELAGAMSRYWVQFATTGDPNHPGAVVWPPYRAREEAYADLGDVVRVKRELRTAACDLFERIERERRARRRRRSAGVRGG